MMVAKTLFRSSVSTQFKGNLHPLLFLNQLTRQNKVADKHCEELKLNNLIKQLTGHSTR